MKLITRDKHSGIEWRDQRHGYPIVVRAICVGHRCGYVGLPPDHPLYGIPYWPDTDHPAYDIMLDIDTHAGLTFADKTSEDEDAYPDTGNYWWFGFDCAHPGDAPDPEILEEFNSTPPFDRGNGTIKGLDYVVLACNSLADQLYAAEGEIIEDKNLRRAFMAGHTRHTTWEDFYRQEKQRNA